MSVAQIENELETLSLEELRAVEEAARRQQWRRRARVLDESESRLFHVINQPLPGGERLLELRARRDDHTLAPAELAELIELDDRREIEWANKLRAVAALADHRGVAFETLYRELELHLRAENSV